VDELRERLTRLGLASLGKYGFALAHGLVARAARTWTTLFTNLWDPTAFGEALSAPSKRPTDEMSSRCVS
jgi:hypothetical protein